MMMMVIMMPKSMGIRKGFAAEYCHSDEDDADDAEFGVDADDNDNDADVDEDTERVCS